MDPGFLAAEPIANPSAILVAIGRGGTLKGSRRGWDRSTFAGNGMPPAFGPGSLSPLPRFRYEASLELRL